MPAWIVTVSSIFNVILSMWVIVTFPIALMFLGVYGSEAETFRGKLIVKLLLLFPIVTGVSLYIAWTSNSYFSLLPFIYIFILYSIRSNKNMGNKPRHEYSSKQKNIDGIQKKINHHWEEWTKLNTIKYIAAITFFAPTHDDGIRLKEKLSSAKENYTEMEITTFENGLIHLDIKLNLASLDKSMIEIIVNKLIVLAWGNKCELNYLRILEG